MSKKRQLGVTRTFITQNNSSPLAIPSAVETHLLDRWYTIDTPGKNGETKQICPQFVDLRTISKDTLLRLIHLFDRAAALTLYLVHSLAKGVTLQLPCAGQNDD